MAHDIGDLQEKIARIEKRAVAIREMCVVLMPIIHRPGWTTPTEYAFVEAALAALQNHLDSVAKHYGDMIEIAEKIGKR